MEGKILLGGSVSAIDEASYVKVRRRAVVEECESALPPISEDVLDPETLVHWKRNLSARRFLQESGKRLAGAVRGDRGARVWLQRQRVRVYREVGNMRAYALSALKMVWQTPKRGGWSEDSVHARLELVSSLQMRIPNFDTSVVKYARWEAALMAPLALVTEAAFWILRLRVIGRGLLGEDSAVAGISAVASWRAATSRWSSGWWTPSRSPRGARKASGSPWRRGFWCWAMSRGRRAFTRR